MSSQASRAFKAGEIIIKQGEAGRCAYIIEQGRVEIFMEIGGREEQIQHIGTRGPGAMIGEMAILDNAPRTATIRALEDSTLLEISREDFARRLESADPVLRQATQVILTRYRDLLARADIRKEVALRQEAENAEKSYVADICALEAIKIARDFEAALQNGADDEICLHYQPIVNLQSGKIAGMEALMRWRHPENGHISPAVFIPIIEETGLVVGASKWALGKALKALKAIQSKTGANDLFMSVNFSSHDFAADGFIDMLYESLSRTGVRAECLHMEITERLLIGQPETAREILGRCRKAGMNISIDDFGTGYSSLGYLHYFPIDTLKIDRSFVQDMNGNPNSLELVKSIVALGKNLKMSIIAEGVETLEEAEMLRNMGCDMAQGYYFSKPLPEGEVLEFTRAAQ